MLLHAILQNAGAFFGFFKHQSAPFFVIGEERVQSSKFCKMCRTFSEGRGT
jgi:hypothetical protein